MDIDITETFTTISEVTPPDPKYYTLEFWTNFFSVFFKNTYFILFEWELLKVLLAIISIFFITLICYCAVRMLEIRKKESEHLQFEIAEYAHHQKEKEENKLGNIGFKNAKWENVLFHLFEPNVADWRLAIIEADLMLETLLDQLAYKGDSIGEKLKTVDREKFKTLSSAWEAHIVRNKIAHEGLDFNLSQHEAKRVIALYEEVFREFAYI